MINVIATIQVKEGQVSKFLEIFKSNIPNVLKEQGCISYVPTIDVPTGFPPQELNDRAVTIIEQWATVEDLRVHSSAPHMLAYREKVKDLVEGMSLKVLKEA